MKWLLYLSIITLAAVALIGCATVPHATTQPVHEFVGPGTVPTSLTHVAKGLDVFILLSVVVVGIGVGLFFWLPTAHNLSLALVFLGGGIEASSLATRVSLWAIPWVILSLGFLAIVAFLYELFENRSTIEAVVEKTFNHLSPQADVKKD